MTFPPFFQAGKSVIALPNWERPRLLFERGNARQRWHLSSLYPAYRPRAQVFKLALRIAALLGLRESKVLSNSEQFLDTFTASVLPPSTGFAVLLGTPGPAQKLTVQLWQGAEIIAYLKYAEKPAAKIRLEHEHTLLSSLPQGIAPKPLKYGPFGQGTALLTEAIRGRALPARLPPPPEVALFLDTLHSQQTLTIDEHPWIQSLLKQPGADVAWLKGLRERSWAITLHHGDFAPWNIMRLPNGTLRAIDWEFGGLEGFPYLDVTYYLLQVAFLINHWSPVQANDYAVTYLQQWLTSAEATSLVKLTAFHAYHQALTDGHSTETPLQLWRRAVWQKGSTGRETTETTLKKANS
jgi:hypothetical protein